MTITTMFAVLFSLIEIQQNLLLLSSLQSALNAIMQRGGGGGDADDRSLGYDFI